MFMYTQVKENFERFISCKSTIDDIHTRLQKAEGAYGVGADGASTADMVTSVNDVSPAMQELHTITDAVITNILNIKSSACAQCLLLPRSSHSGSVQHSACSTEAVTHMID